MSKKKSFFVAQGSQYRKMTLDHILSIIVAREQDMRAQERDDVLGIWCTKAKKEGFLYRINTKKQEERPAHPRK